MFWIQQLHEHIPISAFAQVFPSISHTGLGKVLQISKVTGTGLAPTAGGYFKVSTRVTEPAQNS